ncbi:hypothetical protein DFH09DRAFT_1096181 [Mycena vulgaris]|nr:hypothetical protein DFH09DRAFT_1096181 [Mycena vulgaris]
MCYYVWEKIWRNGREFAGIKQEASGNQRSCDSSGPALSKNGHPYHFIKICEKGKKNARLKVFGNGCKAFVSDLVLDYLSEKSGMESGAEPYKVVLRAATSDKTLLNILFRMRVYQEVSEFPFDGMSATYPVMVLRFYFAAIFFILVAHEVVTNFSQNNEAMGDSTAAIKKDSPSKPRKTSRNERECISGGTTSWHTCLKVG